MITFRHWRSSWWIGLCLSAALLLTACNQPAATSSEQGLPPGQADIVGQATDSNMADYKPRLNGKATVEMVVNGQTITIQVDGENAPVTAGNFIDLVEQGFYDGKTFHRVVEGFVAQGGDPKGDGTGGFIDPKTQKPRNIPLEIALDDKKLDDAPAEPIYNRPIGQQGGYRDPPVVLPHKLGAVAMARSQLPNSASSQFYFTLSDETGFLDGDYAVFGYVTQGMDVVNNIKKGDKISTAQVTAGADNLQK